jgi:hypothetical protein
MEGIVNVELTSSREASRLQKSASRFSLHEISGLQKRRVA